MGSALDNLRRLTSHLNKETEIVNCNDSSFLNKTDELGFY